MLQLKSKFKKVMDAGYHFKNGASSKIQMSRRTLLISIICFLLFTAGIFFLAFNACTNDSENNPGIILGFDDYFPIAWEQHFNLFEKYNAKVIFFVQSDTVTQFMLDAQARGHEIGYHTINHPSLPSTTTEKFFEETISRIQVFQAAGIELTSFAYPYGRYDPWMHDELLKYYKIVRGNVSSFRPYSIIDLKSGFFVSSSIDNIKYKWELNFRSSRQFQNKIAKMFPSEVQFRCDIWRMVKCAKKTGKIIILTSHNISTDNYAITPERLEYVLKTSQKKGLRFYTFKDLQ